MWFNESVFYQVCTLDFCGAPKQNDGVVTNRISRINDFISYYQDLGINAIYFNPIFSSDTHGYDTRDYQRLDERLGTNNDFKEVVKNLHQANIKVVIDGVFNHVGRGFFAFEDVKVNQGNSRYKDWFKIDFNGNSNYNDGFYYEGWEGHYELVKLNLDNSEVQNYLMDCVALWINELDIDGIRLDVAYSLPNWFMAMLRDKVTNLKNDFFLIGEVLGDNAGYMFSEAKLDSITDYPSYKGIWSSFNNLNMFEIAHTIKRNTQEMYQGKALFTFIDNHDVERIASKLSNEKHLPLVFGFLMSIKGIPCIYYGSEWGQTGVKQEGSDDSLRPEYTKPLPNELTEYVKKLIKIRTLQKAFCDGDFKEMILTNKQMVFERKYDDERIIVAINIDEEPYELHFNADAGRAMDLITNTKHDFGGGSILEPYSIYYWKIY